ncbi:MAG: SpoIIE family protein phosphatase [Crocinitomicaceae bacterium]|nr:SpoIIE family protein phosphatase [Crocinitomicaceae bacterium]
MKFYSLLLFFFIATIALSQRTPDHLILEGTIMGYNYDPAKFLKKEKIEIQGSLSDVKITVESGGSKITTTSTDKGGEFAIKLPLEKHYLLKYSKSGYGNSAVDLDLRNIPADMAASGLKLTHIELILNDNETDKSVDNGASFGKIYYNSTGRKFEFKEASFDKKDMLFKDSEDNTMVNLIKASLDKNKNSNNTAEVQISEVETPTTQKVTKTYVNESGETVVVEQENGIKAKTLSVLSKTNIGDIAGWSKLSDEDISNRAKEISDAWEQLEKDKLIAVTEEDFILIQAREQLLMAAEKELEAAKTFIAEQDAKLSAQKNFNYTLIGLLLILAGFVVVLIKSIIEKKKSNFELAKKNKKIMTSIEYAERIQKSVLLKDSEIKALLPNSFVYYQPLDVVSGDFYWFSEANGKVIVAAVDCTGHGVPGAFMSLIGNTLMNQIVKEKKIYKPGEILKHLHEGVVQSLSQEADEDAAQDGMDMSICSIDTKSGEVIFSGAMNPAYVIQNGEFKELSANLRGIGGVLRRKRKSEISFEEETIQLNKGDVVYLFSDGYMDQFGGTDKEKFNIGRFRELLLNIYSLPAEEQRQKISDEINSWKGVNHQVDDMLVIGAKI